MKSYYSSYVNHILRFFTRYPNATSFKSKAEQMNYESAERVFSRLTKFEREVMIFIYASGTSRVEDGIRRAIDEYKKDEAYLYTLVSSVCEKIAIERGLI